MTDEPITPAEKFSKQLYIYMQAAQDVVKAVAENLESTPTPVQMSILKLMLRGIILSEVMREFAESPDLAGSGDLNLESIQSDIIRRKAEEHYGQG